MHKSFVLELILGFFEKTWMPFRSHPPKKTIKQLPGDSAAVTFSSPNVGGHLYNRFSRGAFPKRSPAELSGTQLMIMSLGFGSIYYNSD